MWARSWLTQGYTRSGKAQSLLALSSMLTFLSQSQMAAVVPSIVWAWQNLEKERGALPHMFLFVCLFFSGEGNFFTHKSPQHPGPIDKDEDTCPSPTRNWQGASVWIWVQVQTCAHSEGGRELAAKRSVPQNIFLHLRSTCWVPYMLGMQGAKIIGISLTSQAYTLVRRQTVIIVMVGNKYDRGNKQKARRGIQKLGVGVRCCDPEEGDKGGASLRGWQRPEESQG